MAYDGVPTWRVYSAEQSLALGRPIADVEELRAFVRKVRRSAWWRSNVGDRTRVYVDARGNDQNGWVNSYSRPNATPPTRWKVSIHPSMLNDVVALHELSHTVAPRWVYGGPTKNGRLPNHYEAQPHGPGFAGIMAELVGEFGGVETYDELREAYAHFEVPAMTLEEYRTAVEESDLAEADMVDFWREVRARDAQMRDQAKSDEIAGVQRVVPLVATRGVIPAFGWGDTFLARRYRIKGPSGRRASRDWVAEQVSKVEKCTRRDIERVERLVNPPSTLHDYRIALCMAVLFGMDPIYMRFRLGLVRWECDIELEQLALLNQNWFDLVDRMNGQLEARPPMWAVEGDR